MEDNKLRSRKIISRPNDFEESLDYMRQRDFETHSAVSIHPGILRVFELVPFPRQAQIHITMDCVGGGNMADLVDSTEDAPIPGFDLEQKFIMAFVMAKTVAYLHEHRIIYRDLKTDNWLIDENLLPVLTDFGSARFISDDPRAAVRAPPTSLTYMAGTAVYSPPELLTEERIQDFLAGQPTDDVICKIDVWTFGMNLYELFTGRLPFPEWNKDPNIIAGARPVLDGLRCPVKDICTECWAKNPDDRPSMEQVVDMIEAQARADLDDGTRFRAFVDAWDDLVARCKDPATQEQVLHGTAEKVRQCSDLGIPGAIWLAKAIADLGIE
jgi:serine/threonine protein kinase